MREHVVSVSDYGIAIKFLAEKFVAVMEENSETFYSVAYSLFRDTSKSYSPAVSPLFCSVRDMQ